ncbi:MAG: 4Fe-4S dicluster domain-containing protein [Acidobacteriota bacterium]
MEPVLLPKDKVGPFLESLRPGYRVIAPRRIGPADVIFDDYPAGGDVPFDYVNSVLPPKALFFRRREALFSFRGDRRPALSPAEEDRPLALFGLRSCDAVGLTYLHRFFAQRGFEDAAVTGSLDRSLRMTLACGTPGPECFCVCCDGGPFLAEGFDVQFTDLGAVLFAEAGSVAGAVVLESSRAFCVPATSAHVAAREALVRTVDAAFRRRSYMADGMKRVSLDRVPSEKWESWARDCQGCGGCCFVCPTCSCFTVCDVSRGQDSFQRERSWDTCLYDGFTREASGHNPRGTKGERLKRRFFHKMSYQYAEIMGRHGCVGCGRCVAACMGGLDMSSMLGRIKDECP